MSVPSEKLQAYCELMRLDRPYGTFLLLIPAYWSLVVASDGVPSSALLLIFGLGALAMRSAGCVINDIFDQNVDRQVERTRLRPIASGRLTTLEAIGIFGVLCLISLALILSLNRTTQILAFAGFCLAIIYPCMKRVIRGPQLVMGVAFGWGALMAWTAVRGRIEAPAVMLFLATVAWATAYDTIYAMMDRSDDARLRIGSAALLFGRHLWLAVGLLFLGTIFLLAFFGRFVGMGPIFFVALVAAAAIFFLQMMELRRPVESDRVFAIFRSNVGIGLMILVGIIVSVP